MVGWQHFIFKPIFPFLSSAISPDEVLRIWEDRPETCELSLTNWHQRARWIYHWLGATTRSYLVPNWIYKYKRRYDYKKKSKRNLHVETYATSIANKVSSDDLREKSIFLVTFPWKIYNSQIDLKLKILFYLDESFDWDETPIILYGRRSFIVEFYIGRDKPDMNQFT